MSLLDLKKIIFDQKHEENDIQCVEQNPGRTHFNCFRSNKVPNGHSHLATQPGSHLGFGLSQVLSHFIAHNVLICPKIGHPTTFVGFLVGTPVSL